MKRLLGALALASAVSATALGSAQAAPQAPKLASAVLIHNAATGMCVDLPEFGPGEPDGPVNQWYCRPTNDNQYFMIQQSGTNAAGTPFYRFVNTSDGLCLDLPYYDSAPAGTEVSEYYCRSNDNQDWYLEPRPNDTYFIRNVKADQCLDVPGYADGGPDARLGIYPCRENDDHEWWFG
ncbi:Ricin-type beta-trefoil lectin domain-containing protein [Amycolatopsis xylanica]|uniref:Ricin-type beta-trefoil lectin domain-containing protein n=1 Tax=Amycolatopsis xylanica TaxID=589385 RepID=A0A1H3R0M3_9PSEU|nr:RICIN domain-containing protein [Amycolatopsis xylanica]SDZ19364.1 Ricin-type beta-trefoil lectin domain-containing protein [Amycolatopsis xylanica]